MPKIVWRECEGVEPTIHRRCGSSGILELSHSVEKRYLSILLFSRNNRRTNVLLASAFCSPFDST